MLHIEEAKESSESVINIEMGLSCGSKQLISDNQDDYQDFLTQHSAIKSKGLRLEERYIEEEIGNELYTKYKSRHDVEKFEIEGNLMKLSNQISNLKECVDLTVEYATDSL